MTRRTALFSVIGLVVLTIGWALTQHDRPSSALQPSQQDEQKPETVEPLPPAESSEEARSPELGPLAIEQVPILASDTDGPVTGFVLVAHHHDWTSFTGDGAIEVTKGDHGGPLASRQSAMPPARETIPIVNGHWTVGPRQYQMLLEGQMTCTRLLLDRNVATSVGLDAQGENGSPVLRATLPANLSLRVLDSSTGRDLSGLDVAFSPTGTSSAEWSAFGHRLQDILISPPAPPHSRTLASDATSPVLLTDQVGLGIFWISAPGYSWTKWVPLDWSGEAVVELERSATVEVVLTGNVVRSGMEARLDFTDTRRQRGPALTAAFDRTGRAVLDRIPPGEYLVRAQRDGRILAEDLVRLSPEAWREVDLNVAGVDEASVLSATIVYPPQRARPSVAEERVLISPCSEATMAQGAREVFGTALSARVMDDGRLAYSVGPLELAAGEYWIEVESFHQALRVSIEPGSNVIRFELGEPRPVVLAVLDAASGATVDLQACSWSCIARKSSGDDPLVGVRPPMWDVDVPLPTNPLLLDLVPGWASIRLHAPGYGTSRHLVHIDEDAGQLEISLQARVRIFLGVEGRSGIVYPDVHWVSRVRVQGPDGAELPLSSFGNTTTGDVRRSFIAFEGEGQCTISGGWFDGLGWLAPRQLDVEPGSEYEVTLLPKDVLAAK